MKKNNQENKRGGSAGFELVEALIGSAIVMLCVVLVINLEGGLSKLWLKNTAKVQAVMLLEEGLEGLRNMRDRGWTSNISNLNSDTSYWLYWTGSNWSATTTPQTIDAKFNRSFVLNSVTRDSTSYNIVTNGNFADTGTKKVTMSVSWVDDSATTTKQMETYLYNIFNN